MPLTRRELVIATIAAAAGLPPASASLRAATPAAPVAKKKILFFTKSAGFEHQTIRRTGGKLSVAETIFTQFAQAHGYAVHCSKDGRLFEPDRIHQWDAFAFYTTGDLTQRGTDRQPPMTAAGKRALLNAIFAGHGFIGLHCATDTFHSKPGKISKYIQMIGGEFAGHGDQQVATNLIVDSKFPGISAFGKKSFRLLEEWYTFSNLARDMRVITMLDTHGLVGPLYHRPNYPNCWIRQNGKGRVFYSALGHREATWKNPAFQDLVVGGLDYVTGRINLEPATELH